MVLDVSGIRYANRRGCERKKPYISEHEAKQARRRMRRTFGNGSTVYRCKFCGMWHLTTIRGKGSECRA